MEKNLDKLLEFFREFRNYPLHFMAFLLLCSGIYLLYSEIDYIKSMFPPTAAEENLAFRETLKRNTLINQALENTHSYLGADIVAIAQFHNNQFDLTRLPFTKISITYFVGNPEIPPAEIYMTRPISSVNALMVEMWRDKENPICINRNVTDITDISYRNRLLRKGEAFVALCPLTNILNYPIGYIAMEYDFVPSDTDKAVIEMHLRQQAYKIAGYLQEGHGPVEEE